MTIDTSHVLFDASPTSVILLSSEGEVLDLNRAALRALGVERDRVVSRPILARIILEDRDRARDAFLHVLEGQVREWTARFIRGDAAIRVQRVRAVLHREGDRKQIVMFARDITESREGRPETLQLQTVLENLPGQFAAVLDTRGRIRYSSGLGRLHYRDDLTTVGSSFAELLDPDHWSHECFGAITGAVGQGEHWTGTIWHKRLDGVSFPVRLFVSPYLDPARGRVLGALVVGQDVTVEHNWRDRARSAEHLAGLGTLTADVARAFDAGLTRATRVAGDPLAVGEELTRLSSLASAVNEIADAVHIHIDRFSLDDLVSEVVERMRSRLAPSGIDVSVQGGAGPAPVVADRGKCGRALELLMSNAIDSVREHEVRHIGIWLSADPDHATVEIADSGPIIPDGVLDRAFDPMFTTKPQGVGMGLSLARSIVRAHDGKMWAERGEEGRVTFAFSLPTRVPPSEFRPTPLRIGRTRTVLVVDDEEEIRVSMRRFLEKVGYEVREAWSGRSAIAQITTGRPPELMLTDLRMSDGSGSWLLNQLAEDFPDLLRRTAVITGDPDRPDFKEALGTTGCPVLTKPIDLPDLLEVLDELALRD